jgi:hypothetical protein
MSDEAIISLLNSRPNVDGKEMLSRLNLTPEDRYARRVLRLAAEATPEQSKVSGSELNGQSANGGELARRSEPDFGAEDEREPVVLGERHRG